MKPDPALAFQLFQSVVEYHVPKLARTEIAGQVGINYIVDRLPLDATFKMIAKVVAIVALVVWLIMEARKFLG